METTPPECRWTGALMGLMGLMGLMDYGLLPKGAIAQSVPPLPESRSPASPTGALEGSSWDVVPSVNQLATIQPQDWEYQLLAELVQRYDLQLNLLQSFPVDNQPLTRYEFATLLNEALLELERLGQYDRTLFLSSRDYQDFTRLLTQFEAELESLGDRLSDQEGRVAQLEINRFSPTARLNGEAVVAIADRYGGTLDTETTLQYRLRFNITTSFTGEDAFLLRLAAGEAPALGRPSLNDPDRTAEGTLTPAIGGETGSDLELERLTYTFPVGDRITAYLSATGGLHSHYVHDTFSPYFEDFTGGNGSISAFSQSSPIYSIGGGAGLGVDADLVADGSLALSLGYLAERAAAPDAGNGLFNGDYSLLGQLTVTPSDRLSLGLTYVRGFHTRDSAIFDFARSDAFLVGTAPANITHIRLDSAATTNSYGLQATYRMNHRVTLNAFGGYTDLQFRGGEAGDEASSDIWYYGLGLAFPDLVLPNSLAGVVIGVEPYLAGLQGTDLDLSNATSLHVEVFYKLQLSDFISLAPGLIWVTAPNQESDRPDFVVSTFRTTFRF